MAATVSILYTGTSSTNITTCTVECDCRVVLVTCLKMSRESNPISFYSGTVLKFLVSNG